MEIRVNNQKHFIGRFDTARAYDNTAIELLGKDAKLNFNE